MEFLVEVQGTCSKKHQAFLGEQAMLLADITSEQV